MKRKGGFKGGAKGKRPRLFNPGAIRTAIDLAKTGYDIYTTYKSKRKNGSYPVSSNHENRTLYKRKPMPKGKKKSWLRFKKKVTAVANSNAKKIEIYHKDAIDLSHGQDSQNSGDFSLYTGYNTSFSATQDLKRCFQVAAQNNTSDFATASECLYFKSAVMNVTFYNAGDQPAYIDLYWFYSTKSSIDTPHTLYTRGLATAPSGLNEGTGVGVAKTSGTFGAQPFMSRSFCQYNKIYKVTKHLIPPSNTIEFQIKDPKNHLIKIPKIEMSDDILSQVKGLTQGFLAVTYGVPNNPAGGAGQYGDAGTIYCRREVTYKFHQIDAGSKERIVEI